MYHRFCAEHPSLKSLPDPPEFALRDDMLDRTIKFTKILDKASTTGSAHYLFPGNLNTTRLSLSNSPSDFTGSEEIERLFPDKYHTTSAQYLSLLSNTI